MLSTRMISEDEEIDQHVYNISRETESESR